MLIPLHLRTLGVCVAIFRSVCYGDLEKAAPMWWWANVFHPSIQNGGCGHKTIVRNQFFNAFIKGQKEIKYGCCWVVPYCHKLVWDG